MCTTAFFLTHSDAGQLERAREAAADIARIRPRRDATQGELRERFIILIERFLR